MNSIFNPQEYSLLHRLAFDPRNKGYDPKKFEAPNGDGKIDYAKRYAHIARKYIEKMPLAAKDETQLMRQFLNHAHGVALGIAIELGIPQQYMPDIEDGTLRVLEYDHTAGSEPHKDFDLFSVMCYRNLPDFFEYVHETEEDWKQAGVLQRAQKYNEQIHFGEIMELICPSTKANKHKVRPTLQPGIHQYSVVYFAMPKLSAVLPSGETVETWLEPRKNRSRY